MVETLQNCVILPHLPNWTENVKHTRTWATEIASGIAGGEDRAGARTLPLRSIQYRVETLLGNGPQENEVLSERVKAALASGRAVCPLFGRAQPVNPVGLWSFEAGGLWPWTAGEYAFLTLPEHTGINQEIMIDCGGSGTGQTSGHQSEDNFTHSGGAILTTDHAIAANSDGDIPVMIDGEPYYPGDVQYVPPPPASVLQSCRYDDTPGPGRVPIVYTLRVANLWRCKVRLWFCPFAINDHDSTYQITVTGATVPMTGPRSQQIDFNPGLAAGAIPYCPTFLDIPAYPAADGTIMVTITSGHSATMFITAIEVYSTCWQLIPIREVQVLDIPTLVFGAARLKFGSLDDVPAIYPVLFGRLSVGDTKALTNWHGSLDLTVAELMGDAVQGLLGGFNEEICGLPDDVGPGTPPDPLPTVFTLDVGSDDPSSGVRIIVMPLDNDSLGQADTPFSRHYYEYDPATAVTLTAPAEAAGNKFINWTKAKDGGAAVDLPAGQREIVVIMDADYNLIAHYAFVDPPVVTWDAVVRSAPPLSAAITVSLADKDGNKDGTTQFTRTYTAMLTGTDVSFTAPDTIGDYVFDRWQVDGADQIKGVKVVTVKMNRKHNLTANYTLPPPPQYPIAPEAFSSQYPVTTLLNFPLDFDPDYSGNLISGAISQLQIEFNAWRQWKYAQPGYNGEKYELTGTYFPSGPFPGSDQSQDYFVLLSTILEDQTATHKTRMTIPWWVYSGTYYIIPPP